MAARPPARPTFQAQGTGRSPFGPYADVGMELNLRFELKADRFKNLRCGALDRQFALSGCDPGFPTISPNPQYAIRTGGLIGQRLHVNVDFDSEREFDANNNLQVWYEGLEDEILRRVEAGNVTFQTAGSRFISAAIPANNFGVQAVAQLGALELRGIYAQQKGNVVKDRIFTVGETTTQPTDRELRDLDYEQGRFFFAVDPAALPGFPEVDVLDLNRAALPDSLQVASLRVYRVRALAAGSPSNQNIGGVRAVACGAGRTSVDCEVQRAGPYDWEILFEGRDYYVDPSGAWFVLTTRLDQADYLAVSYVTAAGDSVGTFPVTRNPDPAVVDSLRLVYDPKPGVTVASPSFRFEMRNGYRLGTGELERESVELVVTVNQRERALNGQTYLELLGLALANDPNRFDQYNRLFPRERDQGVPLREQFVIFPHLRPLADSTRLQAAERNDSLYLTPRPLLATRGPPSVFALRVHASVSASADRSTLSLNSFEIREGSERIYVGTRLLTRGADYAIDYAAGTVTFLNPDSLFQGGPAQVRAQFEERAAFAVAPTSIYGIAGRYDLGDRGEINLLGMFQNEQSAFTRPPLGLEPSSSFIGGMTARLRFEPAWLTRAADALPGVRTDAPSIVNLAAELAVSQPSPNRLGLAYVEEFEGEASRFIPLDEKRWHWGSLPCGDPRNGCADGARGAGPFGISPAGFDVGNAAALTWQNLPYNADGTPVQFFPQQIDPTIRIAGQAQGAEPVLWLMLKPDTVLGLADGNTGLPNWVRPRQNAPRWRSLTLALSETGIDLSRVEFLEFWVWEDNRRTARANRAGILFDFGSVFEDAIAFQPEAFQVRNGDTTYVGARLAGLGRLDTERDSLTRAWNAALNDVGILTDRVSDGILDLDNGITVDTLPLCSASSRGVLRAFAFGDLRSRCGRENGGLDTEDLDGDFLLDSLAAVRLREDFVRFVFPIGDERYFVRDGGMVPVRDPAGNPDGAAGWRLYRIPFRTDTLQVGQPNLRQVQALRITVLAPETALPGQPDPQIFFGLARVRLVGSTWLKRAETPIRGIAGERGTGVGEVVASVISTESRDLGYAPPPGVSDQAERRDAALQIGATQINEQSLRLLARGLRTGEHAEAFTRFTAAGDKNFLKYRELRVWARGRGPGWEDGDLEFYVKAGKGPDNFYLYRTPVRTASWEPEVVVEFSRWLALRAAVEQAWLRGDTAQVYPGCPDSTLVPHDSSYVMCDGPYLVHVRDPGTAPPNLTAVEELAVGMLRVAERTFVDPAELWVDDIRLARVVDDAGLAGALDLSLVAANLADLNLSLYRRDGDFRELGEGPSYLTDNSASVAGTLRLEQFLPGALGLAMPLTVRHTVGATQPVFLSRSDLRADLLAGV
ncbi:MAG TPA: cell surface protein SprA, partial [Gemmatimonadales bacterium]|nr:cell surface protein SprA [Gemmatimonadales bacterium]